MMLIDEILEYLQYHPMSKRQDIESGLSSDLLNRLNLPLMNIFDTIGMSS